MKNDLSRTEHLSCHINYMRDDNVGIIGRVSRKDVKHVVKWQQEEKNSLVKLCLLTERLIIMLLS